MTVFNIIQRDVKNLVVLYKQKPIHFLIELINRYFIIGVEMSGAN